MTGLGAMRGILTEHATSPIAHGKARKQAELCLLLRNKVPSGLFENLTQTIIDFKGLDASHSLTGGGLKAERLQLRYSGHPEFTMASFLPWRFFTTLLYLG